MGAGQGYRAQPIPAAPGMPTTTDQTDTLLQQRRMALRSVALKRGLQSTFLTTPPAGEALGVGPTRGALGGGS